MEEEDEDMVVDEDEDMDFTDGDLRGMPSIGDGRLGSPRRSKASGKRRVIKQAPRIIGT